MTKTNKTLLCALLALVLTLACALTIMPVAGIKANAAEEVYEIVKDASSLKVGDEIVIVNKTMDKAVSTTQKEKNRAATNVTPVKNGVQINSEVQILTLQKGSLENTFSFYTGSGYLYAAGGAGTKNNFLKTQDTVDGNGSWSIVIDSNSGVATIKANGDATRNLLQYNGSGNNDLFSCYSSGQTDVIVCRKAASHTHAYSDWKHVDGTKTNVKTCNVDGCDTPTVTEACTIVNNVCTVCNYDYTASSPSRKPPLRLKVKLPLQSTPKDSSALHTTLRQTRAST